jgi:hypothetical protein
MLKKNLSIILSVITLLLIALCIFQFVYYNSNSRSVASKNDDVTNKQAAASASPSSAPVSAAESTLAAASAEKTTRPQLDVISFENANSRDTYFTVHKVAQAQKIGKGKGIKVGILDHSFAMNKHQGLYTEGKDFSGKTDLLYDEEAHGYWMASVLREIAPECSIYALNTYAFDENQTVKNMVDAINWAIGNKIDILTYSGEPFNSVNRELVNTAIDKAVQNGIVTTFINNDDENNIYPSCMFPLMSNGMSRPPDLNIFHYDYNSLIIDKYISSVIEKKAVKSGDDIPYFSHSSTSPVTGGFVAILKSINNTLSPKEYKDILIKTSYSTNFYDWNFKEQYECSAVVDIEKAAKYVQKISKAK